MNERRKKGSGAKVYLGKFSYTILIVPRQKQLMQKTSEEIVQHDPTNLRIIAFETRLKIRYPS